MSGRRSLETMRSKLIKEVTSRLVKEFEPEQIILFGSSIWGAPGEDSDLDLLVIVPASELPPARRSARAHVIMGELPASLDIMVKTREEVERLRQVHASLTAEILERGKVLYG